MLSNWRSLERELVDILRRLDIPISHIDGEPVVVEYGLSGEEFERINISELARELTYRGIGAGK